MALNLKSPDEAALASLLRKYEELLRLREERAEGKPLPERRVFRALASELPGALRELDTLPVETLRARADDVRRAMQGAALEPWIPMMLGYHALLRAALRIRLRGAKERDVSDERAAKLASDASAHAGLDVDTAFVRAVLDPPGGRIVGTVVARLSALLSIPPQQVHALISKRRA